MGYNIKSIMMNLDELLNESQKAAVEYNEGA